MSERLKREHLVAIGLPIFIAGIIGLFGSAHKLDGLQPPFDPITIVLLVIAVIVSVMTMLFGAGLMTADIK